MRSSLLYCAGLAFASTVAVAYNLNLEDYPSKKEIVEHRDSKWTNTFWTDKWDNFDYDHTIKPMVYRDKKNPCAQHNKEKNPNAECDHIIGSERRECEKKEHWAVTIEEGPTVNSRNYIKGLKEAGDVKALVLVVGHRLRDPENAKVLVEFAKAGHEIGINTWSHKRLSTLTDRQIVAEIKYTEKAIKEVTGQYPSKYVRPPFGNMDMRVLRIIEELGYEAVLYNMDPKDYKFDDKEDNARDRHEVLEAIKRRIHKHIEGSKEGHRGTISLHHSVGKVPTLVVKEVLEYIKGGEDAGWMHTFVPMGVCLNRNYGDAHKNEAGHEEVVDRREIKIVRTKVDHSGAPAHKAEDDVSKTDDRREIKIVRTKVDHSGAPAHKAEDDVSKTDDHREIKIVRTKVDHSGAPAHKAEDDVSKTELTFAHFKDVKDTNADQTGTSGRKRADAESKTEFSFAQNKVVEDNNADPTKTSDKRKGDDSTAGFTFAPHTGPRRMTPAHEAEEADEKTESRTEITFIQTRTEEEDKPKDATDAQGHTH